jgi:metal-responsive CopG/Arc/MetJ family transcriptional regulator
MKALLVMITEEMHEELRKMSYEGKVSISQIVREAIRKAIEKK